MQPGSCDWDMGNNGEVKVPSAAAPATEQKQSGTRLNDWWMSVLKLFDDQNKSWGTIGRRLCLFLQQKCPEWVAEYIRIACHGHAIFPESLRHILIHPEV